MNICCWINFEMYFKSNSDKLHEQAFSKNIFLEQICRILGMFVHCSCNLSLFDLITKVTEVSVFLLVEENLIEPVKGGNENQY